MRYLTIAAACAGFLVFSHPSKAQEPAKPEQLKVMIKGTAPDSKLMGAAYLTQLGDELQVEITLINVPPGQHAFHIHENGSCADGGNAAGGHFNPDKVKHGFMPKDGIEHSHPGDMGNLTATNDGRGFGRAALKGVTLKEGKYPVMGKSVIVHEKADDFSQPTGNAGGRIACGVIGEKS